jgi:type IV pilus assembly protein PilB
MSGRQKFTGEILVEKRLIDRDQLAWALGEQEVTREFLGAILLKKKWVEERDLMLALSEHFNMPLVDLKNRYIDWEIVKHFSPSLIRDHHYFPFERDERSVTMAVTNPLDAWSLKMAEEEARGLVLKLALTSPADMEDAIKRYQLYIQKNVPKALE